jgi:hypothetical protein
MAETLDSIRERKGFYGHYYRVAINALRILMIMIIFLIIGILIVRALYIEPVSYATSSDGKMIPVKTFEQPPYPPVKE